jgi:hypothetical protein
MSESKIDGKFIHEKIAAVCSTPQYQMKAQKYAGQTPFLIFV